MIWNDSTKSRTSLRGRFARRNAIALFFVALAGAIAFGSFLWIPKASSAQKKKNSCIECHSGLAGSLGEPAKLFKVDIHGARGLSCNDCHGGDPSKDDKAAAKSPYTGYLGTPKPAEIPAFCGKCHSDASVMKRFNPSLRVDQVQEYYTSTHGKRLREGDQNVATCVSCHGIHGIRAATDSTSPIYALNVAETCAKCHADAGLMNKYDVSHDQFDKYKSSVHGNALYEKHDLSAPTCNDCHGNHGAVPPGITSIANICGQCHTRQSQLFQASVHKPVFDNRGLGECAQCHNNHDVSAPTDAMLSAGPASSCTGCHQNDKGAAAAKEMLASIDSFQKGFQDANHLLEKAERAGMEVSRPIFELSDATNALNQARVLIHTSSPGEVKKAIVPGTAVVAKSFRAGEEAFSELNFRRKGLAVSLVFIFFLAALVYLKIRQIESRS